MGENAREVNDTYSKKEKKILPHKKSVLQKNEGSLGIAKKLREKDMSSKLKQRDQYNAIKK